jgi:hypothetical protein
VFHWQYALLHSAATPHCAATQDLALCIHGADLKREHYLETVEFLTALEANLLKKLNAGQPSL